MYIIGLKGVENKVNVWVSVKAKVSKYDKKPWIISQILKYNRDRANLNLCPRVSTIISIYKPVYISVNCMENVVYSFKGGSYVAFISSIFPLNPPS